MTTHKTGEYVLITAARNEAAFIAQTIESVCMQTVRPSKWVIVSDGSTDETDEIVKRAAGKHGFIDFQRRLPGEAEANFASQVFAQMQGYLRLQGLSYKYIGFLDADITFEPFYYEEVMRWFERNPRLGISGGFIHENIGGSFKSRPTNRIGSVAGGIQLFRRECYEAIGGIKPLKVGGMDWVAMIEAGLAGWDVRAFPELVVRHHKPGFKARGFAKECIRQGIMDYVVGSHPLFEILKCLRRIKVRPFCIGSILRMYGYAGSWLRREQRAMSPDAIAFLRSEQLCRIKKFYMSKNNS